MEIHTVGWRENVMLRERKRQQFDGIKCLTKFETVAMKPVH